MASSRPSGSQSGENDFRQYVRELQEIALARSGGSGVTTREALLRAVHLEVLGNVVLQSNACLAQVEAQAAEDVLQFDELTPLWENDEEEVAKADEKEWKADAKESADEIPFPTLLSGFRKSLDVLKEECRLPCRERKCTPKTGIIEAVCMNLARERNFAAPTPLPLHSKHHQKPSLMGRSPTSGFEWGEEDFRQCVRELQDIVLEELRVTPESGRPGLTTGEALLRVAHLELLGEQVLQSHARLPQFGARAAADVVESDKMTPLGESGGREAAEVDEDEAAVQQAEAEKARALQVAAKKGWVEIQKAEERAMSLMQLLELRDLVNRRCVSEKWNDPFPFKGKNVNPSFGKPLLPQQVDLYKLNYYLVLPECYPRGVKLHGPRDCACYSQNKIFTHTNKNGEVVEGSILSVSSSADDVTLTVKMMRGSFESGVCEIDNITFDDNTYGPFSFQPGPTCSYMELVSQKPQVPITFCSHFWGEAVLDFVDCCEEHAKLRKYPADTTYWVCAYANRQHELGMDIDPNPEKTSFAKAMQLADGILLILDHSAIPFCRIWCDYEIYTTMKKDKPMDIVTIDDGRPHLLAHVNTPLPDESGWRAYKKTRRELAFPIGLLRKGLETRLEAGESSEEIDKVRILNLMRGHPSLDDAAVLDLPDSEKVCFGHVNNSFHGLLAIAAWPQAVANGHTEEWSLPQFLNKHVECRRLRLSFSTMHEMTDDQLKFLADGLPVGLQHLDLRFYSCKNVGDNGVWHLAEHLPKKITTLTLNLEETQVGDNGVQRLAKHLPTSITALNLYLEGSKVGDSGVQHLAEHLRLLTNITTLVLYLGETQVGDIGLQHLAEHVPVGLQSLNLDFRGCKKVGDIGVQHLAEHLPTSITWLTLNLSEGTQVGDSGVQHLAGHLPDAITTLVLYLVDTHVGDSGVQHLAEHLPTNITTLELGLRGTQVGDSGVQRLAELLPTSITTLELFLQRTQVGDSGLQHLAEHLPTSIDTLKLDLDSTKTTKEGKKYVLAKFPIAKISS